jgi:hypothetical protein
MVPMLRIERRTSPLPRECSTTELHRLDPGRIPLDLWTLRMDGAGEGNRTLVISLEGFSSTIELHPHALQQWNLALPMRDVYRPTLTPRFSSVPDPPAEILLVEGVGFEPTKAEPADLQSAPFDRSGTPPNETGDYGSFPLLCQRLGARILRKL